MTLPRMRQGGDLFVHILGAIAEGLATAALRVRGQLAQRRNLARAVLIFVAAACTFAFSQQAPTPQSTTTTSSTYAFDRDKVLKDISTAVETKLVGLKENAKLQGFGTTITAFFLVALLVWTSVKTMASGKGFGDLLGEWVPIFVSFGIVNLFLDKSAGDLIVSTMNTIGSAIGGANMSSLDSAIKAGADPIFRAIAAVIEQPQVIDAADTGTGILGKLSWLGASLASLVMTIGAKIVTAFLLVVAGVIMVGHIIMGFISVQLVLALAPVMVPFLMFRPLAWLFDSWLKFLLGACMLKIVVAFLLTVAAGLTDAMSGLAAQYVQDARNATASEALQTDVLLLGLMLIFALLATLLLMQAPAIATGLLSGSAGSVGFGGLRGVSQGISNKSVGGATKAAGSIAGQAGSVLGQAGRNYFSGKAGKNDAVAGRPQSLAYRNPQSKAAYATAYRANTPTKPPTP